MKIIQFIIFIVFVGLNSTQVYAQEHKRFLVYGEIEGIDSMKISVYNGWSPFRQLKLKDVTVMPGEFEYGLDTITINLECGFIVRMASASETLPDSTWIGRKVLLEVDVLMGQYIVMGKGKGSKRYKRVLTPSDSSIYFFPEKNLQIGGKVTSNIELISQLYNVKTKLKGKVSYDLTIALDKIVMDRNLFMFVRCWAVYEIWKRKNQNTYFYNSLLYNKYLTLQDIPNSVKLDIASPLFWQRISNRKQELKYYKEQNSVVHSKTHKYYLWRNTFSVLFILKSEYKKLKSSIDTITKLDIDRNDFCKTESIPFSPYTGDNRVILSGVITKISLNSVTLNNITVYLGDYKEKKITVKHFNILWKLKMDISIGRKRLLGRELVLELVPKNQNYRLAKCKEDDINCRPMIIPNDKAYYIVKAIKRDDKYLQQLEYYLGISKSKENKETKLRNLKSISTSNYYSLPVRKNAIWEISNLNYHEYWKEEVAYRRNYQLDTRVLPFELLFYDEMLLQPSFASYQQSVPIYLFLYQSDNPIHKNYAAEKLFYIKEYLLDEIKLSKEIELELKKITEP